MATRMQQRRGTATQWTDANPILAAGEIGFETDNNQFKVGDGESQWSELSYFKNLDALGGSLDDYVSLTVLGEPDGVATLDEDGHIPLTQLANLTDGAPELLNSINELAEALGDDPDYITTVSTNLTNAVSTLNTKIDQDVLQARNDLSGDITELESSISVQIENLESDIDAQILELTNDLNAEVSTTAAAIIDIQSSVTLASTQIGSLTEDFLAHNLETTNVHGIADTSVLATETDVNNSIDAHNLETTNVHGIADTSVLATETDVNDSIDVHNLTTTNVHGIADTGALATNIDVEGAVNSHNGETTNIHGISNTANLVYQADLSALTTDDISEGTNEYYTDAKAIAANVSAIATAKSEAISAATDAVNAVIASAPTALNTLDELAAALGDDANFASTITTSLGNKVDSYTTIVPKTASYTLSSLTEKDNVVTVTSGSATTLTIPADSTIDFPVGTSLDVFQMGAGQVTLAGAGGVTLNATPGLKLRTQYSTATIFKLAANTWIAFGDLKA